MQFHEHKSFRKVLNDLWRKGGPYQKAAKEIEGLLGRITGIGHDATCDPFRGMRLTKHGESRIKHGMKYDLDRFSRLITVQTDGCCILLYCGDHEDCERWLNERRGLEFVVDPSMRVIETYRSSGEAEDDRVSGTAGHSTRCLYERLPEELYERLMAGVPHRAARKLESVDASVREHDLWEIVAPITDSEQRTAVYDVFAQLRSERLIPAIARVKLFLGELKSIDDVAEEELPEIVDSDVVRRIDPTSPRYAEALRRYMRAAQYRDWMLFMHPEQDRIVDEDFDESAKLVGVSGSGKTCVVVRRAVRLAEKYAGEKILILTLNRALAQLIDELVTACSTDEVRSRIEVKPFFALCQRLMLEFDPDGSRLYDEVAWKSNEHVDEIWQEYYRCETNNDDARVFEPVHDSLLARNVSAERYLREEVDWLRSALNPEQLDGYLDIERRGRRLHLSRGFRERVLMGTRGWEDKMRVVGVVDALGLAHALVPHLPQVEPQYRCVLVDEVQDFGNVELQIVRAVVRRAPNDLFLTGDAAQAVTTKHQRLRDVGIDIPGARSRRLTQNYRNSQDVLRAAYEVLKKNLTEEMLDGEDFEILDPQFSTFSGATPLLLRAPDLAMELRGALAFARERIEREPSAKVCIAICGYSFYELTRFGAELGHPVLDGSTSLDHGGLFISDLAQTKGFEFDLVCVVNCSRGVLPDRAAPEEERHRDLAMLYVAMTRAKTDLVVSYSGTPSPLLEGVEEAFLTASWDEYITDVNQTPSVPVPKRLPDYRYGADREAWRGMTGARFLFSDVALGTSVELSAKLRQLVDGQGLRKQQQSLRWRDLGHAADDFRRHVRVQRLWGGEVSQQFDGLIQRLSVPIADRVTDDPPSDIDAAKALYPSASHTSIEEASR
jgi:hypothetical protein